LLYSGLNRYASTGKPSQEDLYDDYQIQKSKSQDSTHSRPIDPIDPTTGTGPTFPDIDFTKLPESEVADWVGRVHNRIVENSARRIGLGRRRITRKVAEDLLNDATYTLVEDVGLPLKAVLEARSKVFVGLMEVGAFRGVALRPINEIIIDLFKMLAREDRITHFVADSAIALADESRCAKGSVRRFIAQAEKELARTEPLSSERLSIAILNSVMVHSYNVWSRFGIIVDNDDPLASCESCPEIAADALGAVAGEVLGGPFGAALLGGFASMVVAAGPDDDGGTTGGDDDGGTTGG
jgi:hypothetical protein